MLEALKQYFYNHYEDNGEPYASCTSYDDVSEYFKKNPNAIVQDLIYDLGLHTLAKAVVTESMERLEKFSKITKEKE